MDDDLASKTAKLQLFLKTPWVKESIYAKRFFFVTVEITGCQKLIVNPKHEEAKMSDSVYKIIELVGTSEDSWEKAARNAVERAGKSLRDLRIAEISTLDMKVEDGKVVAFRSRVKLSFKYGPE